MNRAHADVEPGVRRQVFARRCTADAGSLRTLRHELDAWLAGVDWPDEEREDIVLAVGEVVANAVDHAYPGEAVGEVAVFGRLCGNGQLRYVDLLVRDWGRWRRPPTDPGYRGHGLTVVRECTGTVTIHRGVTGTAVAMTSRAVPDVTPVVLRPARPAPRRSPVDPGPVVDDRRHRADVLHVAGTLRADAASHASDAASAWQRARSIMSTSTRVTEEARRTLAAQRRRKAA